MSQLKSEANNDSGEADRLQDNSIRWTVQTNPVVSKFNHLVSICLRVAANGITTDGVYNPGSAHRNIFPVMHST